MGHKKKKHGRSTGIHALARATQNFNKYLESVVTPQAVNVATKALDAVQRNLDDPQLQNAGRKALEGLNALLANINESDLAKQTPGLINNINRNRATGNYNFYSIFK